MREPGDPFPRYVLAGCHDALVLFAARWHGRQDAVHIADRGLTGTCVDMDGPRLEQMQAVYPDSWEFVQADVFQYAEGAYVEGWRWDVVTLDPFTNLMGQCADRLETWCSLAKRAVVIGSRIAGVTDAPDGWRVTDVVKRSAFDGGVYWTIVERS